jgi:hypothetical protein
MERDEIAHVEMVVASPHSGLRSASDQTRRMINAVTRPRRETASAFSRGATACGR